MGSTSVEVKGDGEGSFSYRCGDIRVLLINKLPPNRSIVSHPLGISEMSGISPGKFRKVGEGCGSWQKKKKLAVGEGISLPLWLFHETHLSITVSSNQISHLTANFQEEKYPDCHICHILVVNQRLALSRRGSTDLPPTF